MFDFRNFKGCSSTFHFDLFDPDFWVHICAAIDIFIQVFEYNFLPGFYGQSDCSSQLPLLDFMRLPDPDQ